MAKGKKKVKTATSKRDRAADKTPVPCKHDKKAAATTSDAALSQQGGSGSKVVGLTNLGNTCFFNSVLQVLVASPPLQEFFSQPNAKLHQGPLGSALQELFEQVQADTDASSSVELAVVGKPSKAKKQKQKGVYAPQRLLAAVCKVAPHFKGFQQQDSHELLRVLLDGLQTEEAKAIAARLKHNSPEQEDASGGESISNAKTAPQGFLSEVFGGQLSSTVACGACDYTSVTLEPFMDLSLPIPPGTLANLGSSGLDRRSNRILKAKKQKPRSGDDDSAPISDAAVRDEAQGKKLSAKHKKKLLKEERKAVKLDRKKQPKEAEVTSSAPDESSCPAALTTSASSSDSPAQATRAAPDTSEPGQAHVLSGVNQTGPADQPQPDGSDHQVSGHMLSVRTGTGYVPQPKIQAEDTADLGKQGGPKEQEEPINSFDGPHAEPHDVLKEFEQLSPKLPDMPRKDMQDDLAGLFQAAFATCREMSPRGGPPQSPFGSHSQDQEEDNFSLYGDADEAMGGDAADGIALDASDEEQEEKSGEMAQPLLEGFMGDAESVAILQAGDAIQDMGDDDSCTNLGSLFDETAVEQSSAIIISDFGAADEDEISDSKAEASGEASLQSCLQEFFQLEHITWECPGEKQAKRDLRRTSLGADKQLTSTPVASKGGAEATPEREARRTVSFSEAKPVVTVIPGSVEQRGLVFRTSHGDPPFCRPLRLDSAFLLLTTSPDARRPTKMHIKIQPQDEEEATLMLASNVRHLADADVPAPKVGDNEDDVRLAQAQVLMDCAADLMTQKGLDGTRAWCEGGLKLKLKSNADGNTAWSVFGQLPEEEGHGRWEYPSPTDPPQPPGDQVDFEPSGRNQVSSSSSSDSSASSSSSAAERRDSSDFSSLMGSVSGQLRQTAQHGDKASASASAADEAQQESGHSQDIAAGGDAPTAAADADNTEPESTAEAVTQHQTDAHVSSNTDHFENSAGTPENAVHAGVHAQEECLQGTAVPEEGGSGGDKGGAAACEHAASPADKAADEQAIAATEQSDSHHVSDSAHSQGTHQPVSYTKQHSQEPRELKQSAEPGTPKQAVNSTCGSEDSTELPAQASESSCKFNEEPCKPPGATSPRKGGLVNVHRPAVKGYSIHRCPPLLTVHVKRFQQDMRGRLSKIEGAVPFPLTLDLSSFCDPQGSHTHDANYTLLGFVEHMGTMRSGHYVAYVQRGLNVSDSPHLLSLLQKHGMAAAPEANGSQSITSPAVGRAKKKGSAAKASSSSSLRGGSADKDRQFTGKQSNGFSVKDTPAMQADPATRPGQKACEVASHRHEAIASDAAAQGNDADNSAEPQPPLRTNRTAESQEGVPNDWESCEGSSSDKSWTETVGKPVNAVQSHLSSSATEEASSSVQSVDHQPEAPQASVAVEQASKSAPDIGSSSGQASTTQQQSTPNPQKAQAADKDNRDKHRLRSKDDTQQAKRVWYYISDTQVKPVTEADVLSREAYILLYMRTA